MKAPFLARQAIEDWDANTSNNRRATMNLDFRQDIYLMDIREKLSVIGDYYDETKKWDRCRKIQIAINASRHSSPHEKSYIYWEFARLMQDDQPDLRNLQEMSKIIICKI